MSDFHGFKFRCFWHDDSWRVYCRKDGNNLAGEYCFTWEAAREWAQDKWKTLRCLVDHQNTAPLPIYHQMASLPNSTEHRRTSCDDPAMGAEATAPSFSIRLGTSGWWECCSCGSTLMVADGPKNQWRRLRCSNDECENYAVLLWEPIFQAGRA
jgi:hypothetical protein